MKKILIAGGGYSDIPLILAAKKLGFHVITSGNRPNELGHQYSDEYRPADFSDKKAMLSLARDLEIDAICPCCNDFSALSSSYVAEKMGLPGHDPYKTSLTLHHKDLYRQFAQNNDIPTPTAKGFSNPSQALLAVNTFQYPVIIKPVDLTGGKGIAKIQHPSEYEASVKRAFCISRSSRIVIEEFLEGSRHGFSAFLRNGKVVFHFSDDEYYYLNPYLVSAASTPTSAPRGAIDELISQSEKIAAQLKLVTGIFHVQFILQDDRPVIIEICRRPPGDLYIKLVEHSTGIPYSEWIVRGFCGESCNALSQQESRGNFLRHCIMTDREGTVNDIKFNQEIKDRIIDSMMFWKPGDMIENHLVHKFGIIFMEFDSMEEMLEQSNQMQRLIIPVMS